MPYGLFSEIEIRPSTFPLKIELVPERQWGINLRACMSETQWDKVCAEVFQGAGGRCEICGGVGRKHPLECHEVWKYEEDEDFKIGRRMQILKGLEALCPACHRVKHLGFAEKQGWLDGSLAHLARVNGISMAEAKVYLTKAYRRQRERSHMRWDQDITWFRERFPGRLRDERPVRAAHPLGKAA